MYVTKKVTFRRKLILKVLYFNSTKRICIPLIEGVISIIEGIISIHALILWNEHISRVASFKQANTHYYMAEHYTIKNATRCKKVSKHNLTHFQPVLHLPFPLNHQKTYGFQMF